MADAKGPVRNRDLWERLLALVEDDARTVSFVWLKRATEANNTIVDRLSRGWDRGRGRLRNVFGSRLTKVGATVHGIVVDSAAVSDLIDHVGFRVSDLPASRRMYEAALAELGFSVLGEGVFEGDSYVLFGRGDDDDFMAQPCEPVGLQVRLRADTARSGLGRVLLGDQTDPHAEAGRAADK